MAATATAARSAERERFLTDVLITAVEGGIGYWSRVVRGSYRWDEDEYAFADRGVTIAVDTDEVDVAELTDGVNAEPTDDGLTLVRVPAVKMATGIGRIKDGGLVNAEMTTRVAGASALNDAGELDAADADAIFQAAIFGRVIFG